MRKIPFAGIELTSQRVRGWRCTSELPGRPAWKIESLKTKSNRQPGARFSRRHIKLLSGLIWNWKWSVVNVWRRLSRLYMKITFQPSLARAPDTHRSLHLSAHIINRCAAVCWAALDFVFVVPCLICHVHRTAGRLKADKLLCVID